MTFRIRLRRLKPGSLLEDGAIIDYLGRPTHRGPCFIPRDFGVPGRTLLPARSRRIHALNEAGWRFETAANYPSIPPSGDVVCVVRDTDDPR